MKYESTTKPGKCPNCGSTTIADILYGLPVIQEQKKYYLGTNNYFKLDPTLEKKLKEGKIVLGGCFYHSSMPKWFCKNCKTKIFKPVKQK